MMRKLICILFLLLIAGCSDQLIGEGVVVRLGIEPARGWRGYGGSVFVEVKDTTMEVRREYYQFAVGDTVFVFSDGMAKHTTIPGHYCRPKVGGR